MILWYDLKKQGATNESMATTPTLIDHSGNGHDATCYNFAWSGMSGIGGYTQNYRDESRWIILPNRISFTKTETTINVTKVLESAISAYYVTKDNDTSFIVQSYKIKVSGMTDDQTITYTNNNRTVIYEINSNGEHILPQIDLESSGNHCGFIFNKVQESCNITIEQLPLYPNALVSDGVDDYCLVEGLPLLNKEDGYTVIAKREWIGDVNSKSQGFVSKGSNVTWTDGAFYFECVEGGGTSLFNRVFPNKGGNNIISNFAQENLTYLTTAKYNNSDIVNVGDGVDTDKLVVFRLSTLMSNFYASISLYSLLLFNRDLSTDEIEWVKTNLIESEQ